MEDHAKQHQKWWQQIKRPLVIGIIAVIVLLVALIVVEVILYGTGFAGKTLWDWLQLLSVLAVPVVVGFGAVWFTTRQTRISEENRKQQHDTDLQIAEIQQQEEFLRTYFDKISDLLLDKELSTNPNIQSIVRARTLAALHILSTERKAIVLRFLHDSDLLQYVKSFLYFLDLSYADLSGIDLSNADLQYTNLSGANLYKSSLSNANLSEVKLNEAVLIRADLSNLDLSGTNLSKFNLSGAKLTSTILSKTDLSEANLYKADLNGASLDEANLSYADLSDANVTPEQLENAKSLTGATMPDGSIHP